MGKNCGLKPSDCGWIFKHFGQDELLKIFLKKEADLF